MSVTIELSLKEVVSGKMKSNQPSYWGDIVHYRNEIFSSATLTGFIKDSNKKNLHEKGINIEAIEITILPAYNQNIADGFYLLEENQNSSNVLKGEFTLDPAVFSQIIQIEKDENIELNVEIPFQIKPNKMALNRVSEYQFKFKPC